MMKPDLVTTTNIIKSSQNSFTNNMLCFQKEVYLHKCENYFFDKYKILIHHYYGISLLMPS